MRLFTILALAVAIGLATAVSPFASSHARRPRARRRGQGLHRQRPAAPIQEDSPVPDYAFPGVENERVATGLAGFAGTLIVFAARVRRRRRRPEAAGVGMSGHALHETGVAGDPRSPIHRLDPRAKLIGLAGVTLVAVSTPLRAWPVYVACAARADRRGGARARRSRARSGAASGSCSRSCCSSRSSCRSCARATRSTSARSPSPSRAWRRSPRSAPRRSSARCSAVLLGATTSFPDVLHALERLRAPRLLVLIAAFMYRYLFVIVDEVPRMRAALAARGYAPRHALQAAGDRPRRHRAVPAHLRARRARPPGDARARLDPDDAAPGRARLPPRRRALPRRARAHRCSRVRVIAA